MSLADSDPFTTAMPLDEIDSGTSILLTGEDTAALESIFYRLLATETDERAVVLATDSDGRNVKRSFDGIDRGLGDRSTVLTSEGTDREEDVTTIDDLGDLTSTGMEFSTLVASAQQETDRFRAGIFLCSSLCAEVEDTRSVYRFLNSNFLTELRRGDGIGVCAIDTSADIGADVNSIVAGLETSFSGRIDILDSEGRTAAIEITGLDDLDGVHEIDI